MIFDNEYQNKKKVSVTSYGMNIKQDVSIKNLTTFKVGGRASYFCEVRSIKDLKQAIDFARQNNIPFFILGGGSNILVSDSGFDGLVIKIELKRISYEDKKESTLVTLGAGENWDAFVKAAVNKKLYGIENLSFIPGTLGGAIVGNIGAYGMEIKDKVKWVEVFDIQNSKTTVLNRAQCKFGYRDSVFKTDEGKNYIVIRVCFELSKNGKPNLSYKDIKEYFKNIDVPTLTEIRIAIGTIRSKKFCDIKMYGTAGSFFKNPSSSGNKIHLAQLLESLGMKGLKRGNVGISTKQPLVIINYGGASAVEIKNFSEKIAHVVENKTKVKIVPEVIFVGNF